MLVVELSSLLPHPDFPWLSVEAENVQEDLAKIHPVQYQASVQFAWRQRKLPFFVAFVTPCYLEFLGVRCNIVYNNPIGVS